MTNELITVDPNQIPVLVKEGSKIALTQNAEQHLVKLLQLQELVEQAVLNCKDQIKQVALQMNPNFTSVEGDKVRVMYRAYGSLYGMAQEPEDPDSLVEQGLLKEVTKYTVDSKAVSEYVKQNKTLPPDIIALPREKVISLGLKKEKDEQPTE